MTRSNGGGAQGRRYVGEVVTGGADAGALSTATEVLQRTSRKGRFARLLPFLGPAFIACIAYMDPGNFATKIQGGAQFGYLLLWVIVASNIMAMLIQTLSAKLGIATGRNLPEMIRERSLALATHGRAGLDALWAGSIGSKVDTRVAGPLLLVHPPERTGD